MGKKLFVSCVVGFSALLFVGCSSSKNQANDNSKAAPQQFSSEPIPADSPFAKLSYGMGQKEVSDLIGQPSDSDGKVTGKAFNPFYYGSDRYRTAWIYKGQGRLIFNSQGRLLEVHPNADERGYR